MVDFLKKMDELRRMLYDAWCKVDFVEQLVILDKMKEQVEIFQEEFEK